MSFPHFHNLPAENDTVESLTWDDLLDFFMSSHEEQAQRAQLTVGQRFFSIQPLRATPHFGIFEAPFGRY